MAKIKYVAKFSDGTEVTRSSDRTYKTAAGLIDKETGKLVKGTVAFSAGQAKADWRVKQTIFRRGMSYKATQAAKAHNAEMDKRYREEVVTLQVA